MEKIVDLKGEAWIPISVPFLYQTSFADRYNLRDLPIITIALVTPISGSTAPSTPVVYCNVFRAAGEDFAMYQLHGNKDPTTMVQQASLDDKFKVPFDTFEGALQSVSRGVCQSETIGTISDCLRRQSSHKPFIGGTVPVATLPNTVGSTPGVAVLRDPWHLFPLVFWFWRGSRVLYTHLAVDQAKVTQTALPFGIVATTHPSYGDGMVEIFTDSNLKSQQGALHVPYYSELPYHYMFNSLTSSNEDPILIGTYPTDIFAPSGFTAFTISAGDDFMMMYPHPVMSALPSPLENKPSHVLANQPKNPTAPTGPQKASPSPLPNSTSGSHFNPWQ